MKSLMTEERAFRPWGQDEGMKKEKLRINSDRIYFVRLIYKIGWVKGAAK